MTYWRLKDEWNKPMSPIDHNVSNVEDFKRKWNIFMNEND